MYQTCTEFGYFPTSNFPGQSFAPYLPLDFFINTFCIQQYSRAFDRQFIQQSVYATNAYYGGNSINNLSNVVFVNGGGDPWHELSVLKANPANPTVIPILIPQTSHCVDMMLDNPVYDPPELIKARMQIDQAIGQFLN